MKKTIRKFIKEQIKTLAEYERKGNIASLSFSVTLFDQSLADGTMSSVIDFLQNNEFVNKYNVDVEIGELKRKDNSDQNVHVKFSFDISKGGGQTIIGLIKGPLMDNVEKTFSAFVLETRPEQFKPDGPSDDEYDQMAQQSSMDDRRQQGLNPGLEETARDLGYLNEFDKFENIDFDVKSINMVYTDDGRFYGFNTYSEPGLKGKRVKLSYTEEINKFLQSKGIKIEIPRGYDEDILDQIVNALRQQGIEAQHNDYMDVSEAYTSEWDPETAAKNQEYIKKSKKERELKAARDAFEKAEMNGDIRGQELALAAIDLIKNGPMKGLSKPSRLKEMASELGYLNEDEQLSKLLQLSKHADVRDGEEKISKLAAAWDRWNYDNGDKYDDLVDHLFMAAELLGDGYRKEAQMRLKIFNKDVVKVMGSLSEEKENLEEYTINGGQEAARNYPKTEDPGDMFAQKEVEELLPQSFASRNQELKARLQAHANWVKQDRFNNTFVHVQSNTVTDGNNTYRVAMSQHYNGNYEGFKNPKFTEIRVKELDDEFDMEKDLGYYIVDTTALMQDLKNLKTISRQS